MDHYHPLKKLHQLDYPTLEDSQVYNHTSHNNLMVDCHFIFQVGLVHGQLAEIGFQVGWIDFLMELVGFLMGLNEVMMAVRLFLCRLKSLKLT